MDRADMFSIRDWVVAEEFYVGERVLCLSGGARVSISDGGMVRRLPGGPRFSTGLSAQMERAVLYCALPSTVPGDDHFDTFLSISRLSMEVHRAAR